MWRRKEKSVRVPQCDEAKRCKTGQVVQLLPAAGLILWVTSQERELQKRERQRANDGDEHPGRTVGLPVFYIDHKGGMFWQRRIKPLWCVLYRICSKCCVWVWLVDLLDAIMWSQDGAQIHLKEQKIACAAENDSTTVIDWLCEL